MGDGDLRTTLAVGARLLCGWAFVAIAVLDLVTGFQTGPYLVFHLVLLAGGLLLLQKPQKLLAYAVSTTLAVLTTVVAALPVNEQACCMRGLDVRHGYPLTLLGWNHRQPVHFAPAHTVADLAFWFLAWMTLSFLISRVGGRLRRRRLPHPVLGGPSEPAASDISAPPSTPTPSSTPTPVAHDKSVGGLP
jgi:hypothetical protein